MFNIDITNIFFQIRNFCTTREKLTYVFLTGKKLLERSIGSKQQVNSFLDL